MRYLINKINLKNVMIITEIINKGTEPTPTKSGIKIYIKLSTS